MLNPDGRLPKLSTQEKQVLLSYAFSGGMSHNDFVMMLQDKHGTPKKFIKETLDYCKKLHILTESANKYEGYTMTRFGFYVINMFYQEVMKGGSETAEEGGYN